MKEKTAPGSARSLPAIEGHLSTLEYSSDRVPNRFQVQRRADAPAAMQEFERIHCKFAF